MRSNLMLPTLVVGFSLAAIALWTPASAQDGRIYGRHFNGPNSSGVIYGPRTLPGAYYYRGPVIEPFFSGDGWVPEPIFDHSRSGGIDPNIRPPGS